MKNILFLASEAVPFIKTGGLADVVGSLPREVDKNYFDARIMIPKYMCMKEDDRNNLQYVTHFYMDYILPETSLMETGTGIWKSSAFSVMRHFLLFLF